MNFDPSPPECFALGTLAGGVSAGSRGASGKTPDESVTQTVIRNEGPGLRWLRAEAQRRANRSAFDVPARDRRAD